MRSPIPRPAAHCYDCLPEFQEEMMEAGKCLHPEIEFFWILPSSDDPDEDEWDIHGLPFHVSRALVPQGRAKPLEQGSTPTGPAIA